ncbi:MAG TPA: hypothetical protein DDZ67_12565 [Xanthomonadaceae bacterium]|nr:hypothetical protein [Xanthomonadaceae bacterium]
MNSIPSSPYAVGQVWRCKGRTADENPSLLIDRIDAHPKGLGEILHITVRDIQIKHRGLPGGIMTSLPHVPVIAQTFELSDAELIGTEQPDPTHIKGYAEWREAFDAGRAGSYGIKIASILDIVERQLNGLPVR